MTGRYDLIVFDWDGTLMDSTGLIADCIRMAAREAGLPIPTEEAAKAVIGLGIRDSTNRLFPRADDTVLASFASRYRHHFVARDHEAPLYAGIPELLSELNAPGRLLAVATGKSRRGLERALDHCGLRPWFQFSRCADEGFPKPHPDMLLHIMDAAGVEPNRTLMIGDTTHDLELAANAGTDALAVAYGAHPRAQLESRPVRAVLESVAELREWMSHHA